VQQIAGDPSWTIVREVPFLPQKTDRDCGAAALAMVMSHFRVPATVDDVAAAARPSSAGIRVGALRDLARSRGLDAVVTSSTFADLAGHISRGRPVVVGLAVPTARDRTAAHYEVVVGINHPKRRILCLDPARGLRENTLDGFLDEWDPTRRVALVVSPRAGQPAEASSQ
jgi:ABC-type bacteriocin/lantibiotic exporter with double-glycine peptidase domain